MCCLLLLPVLYLAFHVAQAAPAGPGDRETDWQHYLHGWSPQQSPISPSQHQGPWSGSSQSSVGPQHPAANNWSPANAPNSQFWGGHANDAQPSQSWDHALTPPYSFSTHDYSYTPPELKPEDLEFLHDALRDSDTDAPRPGGESRFVGDSVAANVVDPLGLGQREASASSVQPKVVGEDSQVERQKRANRRRRVGWAAEPESLRMIPYVEPLRKDGKLSAAIVFKPSEKLIQDISSRIFAGKLRVVDERLFSYFHMNDYYRKWPMYRRSRRLSLFSTTATGGRTKLNIHMTDHHTFGQSKRLKGTVLENKRYYMFFGVPETLKAKNTIEYYGAGYINAEDHPAVDRHLEPLLDELKAAAETRL